MKRLLTAFAIVIVLVIAAALMALTLMRSSLPMLDGELAMGGISAPVTISRDAQGIAVIYGETRADVAFATGFAHAQDRFFQMDLSRRAAAGELAEIFGERALDADRSNRIHRFRDRAKRISGSLPAFEQAVLAAYTAGVNAGLASLESKPFEYYLLGSDPAPWRYEDAMLVGYSMFMVLNDQRGRRDTERGLLQRVLPAEYFNWMWPAGTEWDAPMIGGAVIAPAMPSASVIDLSSSKVVNGLSVGPEAPQFGSNNWAVSGALTADGRAMVASDMHLGIRVPNTFYRARLVVDGGSDVSGLTLPGTPIVVSGSNGNVAWSFTNSQGDWTDVVELRPGPDTGTYQTPEGPRAFDVHQESIVISGGDAVTLEVRDTIWGPVIDDEAFPNGLAISWIAHHAAASNMNHLALENANDLQSAMTIATTLGMPPQNFVAGDAKGNIGWTIAGQIPLRTDFDATLPADWSSGHGWKGWLNGTDYPRIVNPPSGRIWTANARVVDGDMLALIGHGRYARGARAGQIRDGLTARESFSPADFLAIQLDDRALFLQRWQSLLLRLLEGDGQRREFASLVAQWNARASVDSVGYRLVRGFRANVYARVANMLMSPARKHYDEERIAEISLGPQFEAPLWQAIQEKPAHLLAADYESWDALLLLAVDDLIAEFDTRYGGNLADRTWGERNTAQINHPLSGALPLIGDWLNMPREALAGDSDMPRVAGPAFGASERFGVSPGAEADGYLHMPAGQSGHPMSVFYRAGHNDWVQGRPTPFLPGEPVHQLRLVPVRGSGNT